MQLSSLLRCKDIQSVIWVQVGNMPEPLNDPPEHSTCTVDLAPFNNLLNPGDELGSDNNQLTVCMY